MTVDLSDVYVLQVIRSKSRKCRHRVLSSPVIAGQFSSHLWFLRNVELEKLQVPELQHFLKLVHAIVSSGTGTVKMQHERLYGNQFALKTTQPVVSHSPDF